MKIVIFAGGSGRRLWPISRQSSPKQFEPIIGDRSTLQLAVDRVGEVYGHDNIYISTNIKYQEILRNQLPELPEENIIGEPTRRDLAPAVGLAMAHLGKDADPNEPVAILWGDNYMTGVPTFRTLLQTAETLLAEKQGNIIYMGESPRYANENLGWIGLGEKKGDREGTPFYGLSSFTYRPPLDKCKEMFASQQYVWNTGYFVTTIGFIRDCYAKFNPKMWGQLQQIEGAIGSANYDAVLQEVYPTMEEISFDDAILDFIKYEESIVLHGNMGWSDPGTLYSLKEAIDPVQENNVERGLVISQENRDSLIYNYQDDKLLVVVGQDGMIVINTEDAILVVHKDDVPKIKPIVNQLVGSDLEKYS